MDEKDPKDEELNPQGQDDLNEADDSFGLPDLDYKPLEEESSDTEEEIQAEEQPVVEPDEEQPNAVSDDYTEQETEQEPLVEEETEQETEEEPVLRYQVEETSSNAPKIIGGIIGVLLLAVVIWYFGFYQKQQKAIAEAEVAKQELIDKQKAEEAKAAARKKQAALDLAAKQAAEVEAEVQVQANAGVQILTERSGRYYIVLESFIDADFANDFGNKIAQEGTSSFLIPPYSKKKMQRVAIGGYESMDEAQNALNDLSSEFGTGKWILKY